MMQVRMNLTFSQVEAVLSGVSKAPTLGEKLLTAKLYACDEGFARFCRYTLSYKGPLRNLEPSLNTDFDSPSEAILCGEDSFWECANLIFEIWKHPEKAEDLEWLLEDLPPHFTSLLSKIGSGCIGCGLTNSEWASCL